MRIGMLKFKGGLTEFSLKKGVIEMASYVTSS